MLSYYQQQGRQTHKTQFYFEHYADYQIRLEMLMKHNTFSVL